MTPFGLKSRQLRRQKGVTLQEQAEVLGVSAAYISALEHGQRGKPSPAFVDQICPLPGFCLSNFEKISLGKIYLPITALLDGAFFTEGFSITSEIK